MDIKVMSWNIAGAKVFENLNSAPSVVAKDYLIEYKRVWNQEIKKYFNAHGGNKNLPDIIFLQECIGFNDTRDPETRSNRWISGEEILTTIFDDYKCFFFPSLSSFDHPHPKKWDRYNTSETSENFLPSYINAQQGYGICIKEPNRLRRLWTSKRDHDSLEPSIDTINEKEDNYDMCFQSIPISTGLYLGTRDTEPRLAILGRMQLTERKYINFINLHLTTLGGEREGKIRINREGSQIRNNQVNLILDYIIAAYQEGDHYYRIRSNIQNEDIWIIGGDFNAIPESREISLLKNVGFVDGNIVKNLVAPGLMRLNNKEGTKWSIKNDNLPPIVVDYIFCGIEKSSFVEGKISTTNSLKPFRPNFVNEFYQTDHAVLFSVFGFNENS